MAKLKEQIAELKKKKETLYAELKPMLAAYEAKKSEKQKATVFKRLTKMRNAIKIVEGRLKALQRKVKPKMKIAPTKKAVKGTTKKTTNKKSTTAKKTTTKKKVDPKRSKIMKAVWAKRKEAERKKIATKAAKTRKPKAKAAAKKAAATRAKRAK